MIDWLKRVSMELFFLLHSIETINSVRVVMRIDMFFKCIPKRAGPRMLYDETSSRLSCPSTLCHPTDYYLSKVIHKVWHTHTQIHRCLMSTILKDGKWAVQSQQKRTKRSFKQSDDNNDNHFTVLISKHSFRQFFTIIYFYLFIFRTFFFLYLLPLFEKKKSVNVFHADTFMPRMFEVSNNDDFSQRLFISVSDILIHV